MNFQGLTGILVLLGIAYLLSNNRKEIKIRTVLWGLGLQFSLALMILKVPFVKSVSFEVANGFLNKLFGVKTISGFLKGLIACFLSK